MQDIVLAALLLLFVIGSYVTLNERIRTVVKFSVVCMLSAVSVYFIRVGFGRFFTTIDESYYVSLLGNPSWYKTSIVSGYITPFLLEHVRSVFPDLISMMITFSVLVSITYIVVLLAVYRKVGMSKYHAILAILLLFTTPLYIWSMLQIRPQQIGVLVGLLIALLIIRDNPTFKLFAGMLMLYLTLVFAHVLSFMLYSIIFVLYLTISMIMKDCPKNIARKYLFVAVSIVVSWIVFVSFPYSGNIINNILWIVNVTFNFHMSFRAFYVFSIFVIGASLAAVYIVVTILCDRLHVLLQRGRMFFCRLAGFDTKTSPKYLLWELVGISIVIVFYLQFKLGSDVYTVVYNNSVVALLLFQMGNIFFVTFFLRGIALKIKDGAVMNFDILSLMWIPVGGILLIVSFFMPRGSAVWGFHNWLIRVLQYFTVFASPAVAYSIIQDVSSENEVGTKPLLSLLLGVLIMISVLNTARVPGVYTYDVVWTPELLDLCQHSPPSAVYLPRTEMSTRSIFSTANLLRACGKELDTSNYDKSNYLIMSSDVFYIYVPAFRPISFSVFWEQLQSSENVAKLIVGKNTRLLNYYLSLLGHVISIYPEGIKKGCQLSENLGYPLVLVGGRGVNPCTARLEKGHVVYVYLDAFSLRTPRGVYQIPHPKQWWNAKEGLFVIQTVEFHNTPILLIEGTNADATLAAVYYFVEEVYPNLLSKYKDTKYIVGKWEEKDNTAIGIARLVPQDTTGFSPGDEIEIIEEG